MIGSLMTNLHASICDTLSCTARVQTGYMGILPLFHHYRLRAGVNGGTPLLMRAGMSLKEHIYTILLPVQPN